MITKGSMVKSLVAILGMFFGMMGMASATGGTEFDEVINKAVEPVAKFLDKMVFWGPEVMGNGIPVVLVILAGTAIFLTIYFKFLNVRGIGLAIRTVKGKYTRKNAPGQITHFQALSAALSATVGLGNIAGVGVAIGLGGPGATFWMVILGLCGMTTKFCECTLGVKYREFDKSGKTHGGAMYYLSKGLAERGMGGLGKFLAIFFAIMCIAGAVGAGNMFQVNQAHDQISRTFGVFQGDDSVWFGVIMAVIVGLVIIGGIKSIARVTSVLVPFMCVIYVGAAMVILLTYADQILPAFGLIFSSAFTPMAVGGGFVGVLIQGVKRAAFSNEAGIGSAPIAHSAVKTDKPASEGMVALLEPFTDTVVVCTMTALVLVITGAWKVDAIAEKENVNLYSSPNAIVQMVGERGDYEFVKESEDKAWVQVRSSETVDEKTNEALGWVGKNSVRVGDAKGDDGKRSVEIVVKESDLAFYANPTGEVNIAETLTLGDEMRTMEKSDDKQFAKVYREDDDHLWVQLSSVKVVEGIGKTSMAFKSEFIWFPKVLSVAVLLFAFSTMISWSYYGEQAVGYLFGKDNQAAAIVYKLFFCGFVVIGVVASLGNVLLASDAMLFAMVLPNMIGLYFLLPVVKRELKIFRDHADDIDSGRKTLEE